MKEYLRMSDAFGVVGVKVREGNGRHVMCEDILAANCFCEDSAEYAAHAINSHDELVAEVERLRGLMVRIISSAHELSRKMPTTEFGGGYKQCAMDTANAIESYLNKGA